MAKIITTFAMSLDNYIADSQGGYDWIKGFGSVSTKANFFSFEELLKQTDYLVMGRVSYEEGLHKLYPNQKIIVATTKVIEDSSVSTEPNINQWLEMMRNQDKTIYIFGGAKLIDSIRDQIDEWIIGIVPTMLGSGRRIFEKQELELKMELLDFAVQEGIVLLKYKTRE